MPELPEVETIKNQLKKKLIGKKLNNKKIINIRRRAKLLIIDFDNKSSLVFHLKLTGQLLFNKKPSKITRKIFSFDDKSKLIFNSSRNFSWYKFTKNTKKLEDNFGPEALKINFFNFLKKLKNRKNSKIKNLLLDQKFIAGIGNIYADEILFASKIRPMRRVKALKKQEIQNIFFNIKKILKKAIKYHGSSVRDYFDSSGKLGEYSRFHKVYQKKICKICKTKIKKIKLNSRSAHYCPKCQK